MDISFIIPTLNRSRLLDLTLTSILNQNSADGTFEVIVVDNGSTDATREVCEKYRELFAHFTYCYDDVPGQLTGRHRGLEMAQGNMLCYLDDDVALNPGWLNAILNLSNRYPDIYIFGGPSLPKFHSEPPVWLKRFRETTPYGGEMCLPLSLINPQKEEILISPLYVFGLNFSIRKNTLLFLRGFHPDCIPSQLQHFQGDGETGLAIKAEMHGMKALHASALFLHHEIPSERLTLEYFKKWSFYNGVCRSFTDLRYRNNLYKKPDETAKSSGFFFGLRTVVKRTAGLVTRTLQKKTEFVNLIEAINQTYHNGYAFHQNAFISNEKVREWVLKTDYFDYRLPL